MNSDRKSILNILRESEEPSIRYTIRLNIDNEHPTSKSMIKLQDEIKTSIRIKNLISNVEGIYNKWQGAHWILSLLAELHYPPYDKSLISLRDQVYDWFFSSKHLKSIKTIKGKVRRCASQEGNAIYYSNALKITDKRTDQLVDRLLEFQWNDGGWNCDKNPKAIHSSYHESLIPLRGFILYLKNNEKNLTRSKKDILLKTIEHASELFLKRDLYISSSTGEVIHPHFALLHFPFYWRYNILFALKVINEGGYIQDSRCQKALDLIESKELATGGFPAEKRYYYGAKAASGKSAVNWDGVRKQKMNPWVTSEVCSVLNAAGRL